MAGTTTQTYSKLEQNHDITIITITAIGDAAAATFLDATLNNVCVGKYLMWGEINPGATAPTVNYGFTLVNAAGYDLSGGAFDTLHNANTERFLPIQNNVKMQILFDEAPTITWDATNAVNSAISVIKLYFYQDMGSQA